MLDPPPTGLIQPPPCQGLELRELLLDEGVGLHRAVGFVRAFLGDEAIL